jgi:hypothetical protein
MNIDSVLARMDAVLTTATIRTPVPVEEAQERINKGLPPKEATTHERATVTHSKTGRVLAVEDGIDKNTATMAAVAKAALVTGTPLDAPATADPTLARVIDLERRVAALEQRGGDNHGGLDSGARAPDTQTAGGDAKATAKSKGGQKTPIGAAS